MTKPAAALETASHKRMVEPKLAAEFWAAVEDCLVQFHCLSRPDAAQKVTGLWRRLANLTPASNIKVGGQQIQQTFDDMIYHAEPWYLACNLADQQVPLEPNRTAYEQILKQNHLA